MPSINGSMRPALEILREECKSGGNAKLYHMSLHLPIYVDTDLTGNQLLRLDDQGNSWEIPFLWVKHLDLQPGYVAVAINLTGKKSDVYHYDCFYTRSDEGISSLEHWRRDVAANLQRLFPGDRWLDQLYRLARESPTELLRLGLETLPLGLLGRWRRDAASPWDYGRFGKAWRLGLANDLFTSSLAAIDELLCCQGSGDTIEPSDPNNEQVPPGVSAATKEDWRSATDALKAAQKAGFNITLPYLSKHKSEISTRPRTLRGKHRSEVEMGSLWRYLFGTHGPHQQTAAPVETAQEEPTREQRAEIKERIERASKKKRETRPFD